MSANRYSIALSNKACRIDKEIERNRKIPENVKFVFFFLIFY